MHFNIPKTCIPWYVDKGDEGDVAPDDDRVEMFRLEELLECTWLKNMKKTNYPHSNKDIH